MTKQISTEDCVLIVSLLAQEKERIYREMRGFGLRDVKQMERIETLIDNLNLLAIHPHEIRYIQENEITNPDYVDMDIFDD